MSRIQSTNWGGHLLRGCVSPFCWTERSAPRCWCFAPPASMPSVLRTKLHQPVVLSCEASRTKRRTWQFGPIFLVENMKRRPSQRPVSVSKQKLKLMRQADWFSSVTLTYGRQVGNEANRSLSTLCTWDVSFFTRHERG